MTPIIIKSATPEREGMRDITCCSEYSDPIYDPLFWIIEGSVMGAFIGFAIGFYFKMIGAI